MVALGYARRTKFRDKSGHIFSRLSFYETPQPTAENCLSAPTADLPAVGSPTGRLSDGRQTGGLLNDTPKNDCLRNDPKPKTKVCEGTEPPPTTHTPSFLSLVQKEFPDKDVPGIWQKMLAEYATKPQRLTEIKLREWCNREFPKTAQVSAKCTAPVFPSLKPEPDCYKGTQAYQEFENSYLRGTPRWSDVPDGVRIRIIEELRPELSGPPGWRLTLAKQYPDNAVIRTDRSWLDVPDEKKRELFGDWHYEPDRKRWTKLTMV
jgi:hypothetical protein